MISFPTNPPRRVFLSSSFLPVEPLRVAGSRTGAGAGPGRPASGPAAHPILGSVTSGRRRATFYIGGRPPAVTPVLLSPRVSRFPVRGGKYGPRGDPGLRDVGASSFQG